MTVLGGLGARVVRVSRSADPATRMAMAAMATPIPRRDRDDPISPIDGARIRIDGGGAKAVGARSSATFRKGPWSG
jgi:hypothetical protein